MINRLYLSKIVTYAGFVIGIVGIMLLIVTTISGVNDIASKTTSLILFLSAIALITIGQMISCIETITFPCCWCLKKQVLLLIN
jgi:hypothetical protein